MSTGAGCDDVYAVSIPGVKPAVFLTWFQAAVAAPNSGKRLPTNAEWQIAALGSPDGTPCIVTPFVGENFHETPEDTGTAGCVSQIGAFDMVGNVVEWVAEWMPQASSNSCTAWSYGVGAPLFTDDENCLVENNPTRGSLDVNSRNVTIVPNNEFVFGPGAVMRGGSYLSQTRAGVFAVSAIRAPFWQDQTLGFRAAR